MSDSVRIDIVNDVAKFYFSSSDIKQLVDFILTREVEGAKYINKGGWDGKYRYFNKYGDTCPAGLVPYVRKLLEKSGYTVVVNDNRPKISITDDNIAKLKVVDKSGNLKDIDYFDYQKDTIKKIVENNGGLVYIATNGGKSVIFAGLIKTLSQLFNFKFLVIVHKIELLKQTYELLKINLGEDNVGVITSDKIDISNKMVVVAMIRTIVNRLYTKKKDRDFIYLKESINALIDKTQAVVVDEVHHANATTYRQLFKKLKKCLIKVGLSGTIPSPATLSGLQLRVMFGPIVKRIRNIDLINKDVSLVPKIFSFVIHDTDLDKVEKQAKREYYMKRVNDGVDEADIFKGMSTYVFQRIYEAGVVFNDLQNSYIVDMCKFFIEKGLQTLIVVNRRETHGNELDGLLTDFNVPHVLWTGLTKNRDVVLDKFKKKEVPVMIATSVVDEGLNIHTIDVIILASGMKSHIQLLQRLGRGLRKGSSLDYLIVVDFYHDNHRILNDHSNERLKLWKKEQLDLVTVSSLQEFKYNIEGLLGGSNV